MENSNRAADRVRTVELLSDGEQGQVFVGVDDLLRRRLIVKRMSSGASTSVDQRNRMIREARVLSRLDHANVLRVYDYSESDQYDVFTFEYLEGTPLVEALAAGLEFAKKVRVATVVANVLSVAHRNGIVHGALSPRSVVISKDGTIKVVDFQSISAQVDGSRGDARWSSPEELRGAEPARESDMYRFGLLLQEMFGTRDHDVRALVGALLCEAPSDRLTAAAALERLQRLGGRRARRARIAAVAILSAAVTVGATKFTLDVQRERASAVAARAEADARRAQANELVAFMVDDLRPKLRSVGRLDIMDATSSKAFDYFASIDPGQVSAAETAVNVQAITQFAEACFLRNDMEGAVRIARQAIALADAGLRRHPNDTEILFAQVTAHDQLATAFSRRSGDLPKAIFHANASLSASGDLLKRKPGDTRFRRQRALTLGVLGRIYERAGDSDAAFRNFDLCVTALRAVLREEPNDDTRTNLFIENRFAGAQLNRMGRYREAKSRLESGRREVEAVRRNEPANKELLDTRCGYDDQLAATAVATGDLDTARSYGEALLAASKQLVAFDAVRFRWRVLLVLAHRSIGTIARMNGDFDTALRHHQAAIQAASVLVARGPGELTVPHENAASRVALARSLLAARRPAQALVHADLAVAGCRAMGGEVPARKLLADALLVRGEALAATGQSGAARQAWEEVLRVAQSIPSRPPDPRTVDTHARALLRLGHLDRATPLVEYLAALGYRNREFEALCKEKGAFIDPLEPKEAIHE